MKDNFSKCQQCKHFVQHYNISYDRTWKLQCGHCCKRVGGYPYKLYTGREPCSLFEQAEPYYKEKRAIKHLASLLEWFNFNVEFIKAFANKDIEGQRISDIVLDELDRQK